MVLNGTAFDLATLYGRMIATVLAGIAEFERELIQERIRSGIAASTTWVIAASLARLRVSARQGCSNDIRHRRVGPATEKRISLL
jgi:hypothetical protein